MTLLTSQLSIVLQFAVDLLQGTVTIPCAESQSYMNLSGENHFDNRPEAISMDCEMVGGGSDGSLDLCARVCLTDEDENILFHTYVRPQISITNYRYLSRILSSLISLKNFGN